MQILLLSLLQFVQILCEFCIIILPSKDIIQLILFICNKNATSWQYLGFWLLWGIILNLFSKILFLFLLGPSYCFWFYKH